MNIGRRRRDRRRGRRRGRGATRRRALVVGAALALLVGVGASYLALTQGLVGPLADRIEAANRLQAAANDLEAAIAGDLAPALRSAALRHGGCQSFAMLIGGKPEIDAAFRTRRDMRLCEATPARLDAFLPRAAKNCAPPDPFPSVNADVWETTLARIDALAAAAVAPKIADDAFAFSVDVFADLIERHDHVVARPQRWPDRLSQALWICVFRVELTQARNVLNACVSNRAAAIADRREDVPEEGCEFAANDRESFAMRLPAPFARR